MERRVGVLRGCMWEGEKDVEEEEEREWTVVEERKKMDGVVSEERYIVGRLKCWKEGGRETQV